MNFYLKKLKLIVDKIVKFYIRIFKIFKKLKKIKQIKVNKQQN